MLYVRIVKSKNKHKFMEKFANNSIFWIELNKIVPNPYQPRIEFDESKLKDLSASIKQYGVLQPIVVSRVEKQTQDGGLASFYEIIAGERRFRASKLAGLEKIPAIIREGEQTDMEKLELAIIENLQREDLNPVDKARSFEKLVSEFGLKHAEVAEKMGKSREYVSNSLRLLLLPEQILSAVNSGRITEGHTRPLLMLKDRPEDQMSLFKEITTRRLTVREAEKIARSVAVDKIRKKKSDFDPEIKDIENKLSDRLGTKVSIEKKQVGGKVTIEYFSQDDLEKIVEAVRRNGGKAALAGVAGSQGEMAEVVEKAAENFEANFSSQVKVENNAIKENESNKPDDLINTFNDKTETGVESDQANEAKIEQAVKEIEETVNQIGDYMSADAHTNDIEEESPSDIIEEKITKVENSFVKKNYEAPEVTAFSTEVNAGISDLQKEIDGIAGNITEEIKEDLSEINNPNITSDVKIETDLDGETKEDAGYKSYYSDNDVIEPKLENDYVESDVRNFSALKDTETTKQEIDFVKSKTEFEKPVDSDFTNNDKTYEAFLEARKRKLDQENSVYQNNIETSHAEMERAPEINEDNILGGGLGVKEMNVNQEPDQTNIDKLQDTLESKPEVDMIIGGDSFLPGEVHEDTRGDIMSGGLGQETTKKKDSEDDIYNLNNFSI